MWYNQRFFKYASGILLVLIIVFMLGKIDFFLSPLYKLVGTISAPLIATGIFYYILRPLVRILDRFRLPRAISILVAFALVLGILALISSFTGAIINDQLTSLLHDLPGIIRMAQTRTLDIINHPWFQDMPYKDTINQKTVEFLSTATQSLTKIVIGIISTITNIGTILLLVPFILFYFLKDDRHFAASLLKILPKKYCQNAKKIITDIDTALSSYIVGQMLVALAIGLLMFAGYLIIGLKYSLVLAIFAMMTCIIPFFGPWLGVLPAMFIGLTTEPLMALKALGVMLVVQQIDNNFISPYVMGKRLDIHPVTVILLLMAGISLYGFIGLILAIPVYAAIKATVRNIYEMYLVKYIDFDE